MDLRKVNKQLCSYVAPEAIAQGCTLVSMLKKLAWSLSLFSDCCLNSRLHQNSLFYKTDNGARVGDLFMSLIHTCELCGANAFDYLAELDRHAADLASNPENWMPWNYQATLDSITPPPIPTN